MSKVEGTEKPNAWQWVLLVGMVVGAVLLAAAPIAGGILVTAILPGLEAVRPGLPLPLLLALLIGILAVSIWLDGPFDRAVSRLTWRSAAPVTKVAQEVAGLALLWLLLTPVMANARSALVAALIAVLFYLLTSPLVEAMERRREGQGERPDADRP